MRHFVFHCCVCAFLVLDFSGVARVRRQGNTEGLGWGPGAEPHWGLWQMPDIQTLSAAVKRIF